MTDGPGHYGPDTDTGFLPHPRGEGGDGPRADVHGRLVLRQRAPVPARREPWRVVLVILGCLVGPPAGAVVGFFGAVTYSGCFLSCGDADPVGGALLIGLAIALLLAGPLLALGLIRRASAVGLAVLGSVLGGLGLIGLARAGVL